MKLLILILLSGIYGLDIDESNGIDVLGTLVAKNISCNLHDFVKSANNFKYEYNALIDDLTKYCSKSESTKSYRLLCRMILIELEIGCLLPNTSYFSSLKYTTPYTSRQICSVKNIALTNNWIWEKLTANEKEQFGSTSIHLCSGITASNNTLRLAKFFYKTASSIRKADMSLANKTSEDSVLNQLQLINGTTSEKTNKTNDQLAINQVNDYLVNETNGKTGNNKGNITDSVSVVNELQVKQKETILDGHIPEQAGVEKVNETKKSEEGFPLGRAGEQPEREQINERPIPKALDVEAVFKENDRQEKHWVEGKDVANQQIDPLNVNSKNFPLMKSNENSLIISQSGRKRPSLKLKVNKHTDDDDDEGDDRSNTFITSLLVFFLFILIIYLILRNKNKILGLLIEGCKRRRNVHGRRIISRHLRSTQSL